MKNTTTGALWSDRSKLIMGISLVLLLASTGALVYEHSQRSDLQAAFDTQRGELDRAHAGVQQTAGEMERLAAELRVSEAHAAELDDQRDQAEHKVGELRSRLDQALAVQADASRWRKESERLQYANTGLQQELTANQDQLSRVNADKLALEQKNAALKAEMEQLAANQSRMDNSLAQAFRGSRERLTVVARKARKMLVTLELPTAMAKQASYTITGPDGKVVKGDDPAVSVISNSLPGASLASGGKGATPGADQVKLVYVPKKKLTPGIYRIDVRSGERSIGTTFIALR